MREALLDELKESVDRLDRMMSGNSLAVRELKSCVAEIIEEEELERWVEQDSRRQKYAALEEEADQWLT